MTGPPTQKNVLLLGAGNAHLRFVRMFGMRPMPGVAVTLVSEAGVIPYSAMVPGHIAGEYSWNEVTIDLVRLCRTSGVRFLAARAEGLDVAGRAVSFRDRPEVRYDAVSLGLGSVPARPPGLTDPARSWPMRPLAGLVGRLNDLERRLRDGEKCHLVVVGGGASGCELTLAIRKRFAPWGERLRLTLLHGEDRLMPQMAGRAGRLVAAELAARNVAVRLGALVTGGDAQALEVSGGERVEYDAILWATNAAPPELLHHSRLKCDPGGFLLVRDTLQSHTDDAIFGTGDCVRIDAFPSLARNGVYAVRQGGVLFENVWRFLREKPLTRFQPQPLVLNLLNTSDGAAVFSYGPLAWKGRLARWWKDRIDRRWVALFTRHRPMAGPAGAEEPAEMRCGGCGSKISGDVLSAVLRRVDVGDDPRVLLGVRAGEDASVHRVRPELFGADPARLVEVQTVDYFKAFIDDPYLFGRIAALNSVSDLYAMNARPFTALAIATLPYARGPVQEGVLYELLSGAVRTLKEMGVTLTGGHTTEGTELALGFAVTGFGEEGSLFRKANLAVGDRLILTKPLGSGALLAAWMRGGCPAAWFEPLLRTMLLGNDRAGPLLAGLGVRACTDVTGFGLAGHLLEMLDASGVSARIDAASVPLYAGFHEVVADGVVSTLHADNAKVACRVEGKAEAWLFDPQTSGGLLAAVRPDVVEEALRQLREAGYADAAVIGEVVAMEGAAMVRVG